MATEVELDALSSMLNCPVYVLVKEGRTHASACYSDTDSNGRTGYLAFAHRDGNHFNLVVPADGCCYCQTKPPGPSSQPKEMLQLHTKDTSYQPEETFCTDHHQQQHWRQNQRRHKQQPHKQHEPDQHHSSHMKSPSLCTLPTASRTNTSAIDERRHEEGTRHGELLCGFDHHRRYQQKQRRRRQRQEQQQQQQQHQQQQQQHTGWNCQHTDHVFNYSSKKLSKDHKRILPYGLTFVPSRQLNVTKLLTDLTEGERRMRLREYFYDNNKKHQTATNDKTSRAWTPGSGREPWLDLYIQTIKEDIVKNIRTQFKKNLNRREEAAMKDLILDDSIVIRPADKGSGIVVLDASDYKNSIKKELEDSSTYTQIDKDVTQDACKKLNKLLKSLRKEGVNTRELEQCMAVKSVTAGKLKGNPKIHKPSRPMRTIVSTINHPTEGIAKIAEDELRKGVEKLPSFIKDTTHFLSRLNHVNQPLPPDTLFFTMDVKGLYPNVPRAEARQA